MASNNLGLEYFFESLDRWGLMDVLLPFLLVFAVVFGILIKSEILGKHKGTNIVVSLVVAGLANFL